MPPPTPLTEGFSFLTDRENAKLCHYHARYTDTGLL